MKVLILSKVKGAGTQVYKKAATKKEAKQILSNKYLLMIENEYDNLTEYDGLFEQGTVLIYGNTTYFIEQDKSL